MENKPVYRHILVVSPRVDFQKSVTGIIGKYFDKPAFTYLDQTADALPGDDYNWSDIDLVLTDLSKRKRKIYD